MQKIHRITARRVLILLACILILKVTLAVVIGYRNYLPPNFNSDFLRDRESYFFGSYQWAFYVHIATGPVSLVLGLILVSDQFRRRFPQWHRYLGRIQGLGVLFLVLPSGLWLSYYAAAGFYAAVGFALLSILTGACIAMGWRAALQRRFLEHRRWMWRTFLLLCSAVVLRLIGGLGLVIGVRAEWYDLLAGWLSWIVPLGIYEIGNYYSSNRSLPAMVIKERRWVADKS